jgi:hypothetical protein
LIFIIGTGIDNAGGMPPEISGAKKNRFHGLRGILKLQKKKNYAEPVNSEHRYLI